MPGDGTVNVYLPAPIAREMHAEAERLRVPFSRLARQAWEISRVRVQQLGGVQDAAAVIPPPRAEP